MTFTTNYWFSAYNE